MEQNNINIAALLKNSPKDVKLFASNYGECELSGFTVSGEQTLISTVSLDKDYGWDFDEYGYSCDDKEHKGDPLLFPSKEVRDWGCFKVKFIKVNLQNFDNALKYLETLGGISWHTLYAFKPVDENEYLLYIDRLSNDIRLISSFIPSNGYDYILSTGVELKLEEQSKFKVKDVAKMANSIGVIQGYNLLDGVPSYSIRIPTVNASNNREIAILEEDVISLATPEEIAKWNKTVLQPNHLHYSTSKRKIIHWFLPKDDVLVRDDNSMEWRLCTFSHYSNHCPIDSPYCTGENYWQKCLPYNEKTEKLIGTTNDYKEE